MKKGRERRRKGEGGMEGGGEKERGMGGKKYIHSSSTARHLTKLSIFLRSIRWNVADRASDDSTAKLKNIGCTSGPCSIFQNTLAAPLFRGMMFSVVAHVPVNLWMGKEYQSQY